MKKMEQFNLVVCGGTFDHFHKGHREFLRYGLSISNKLLVGLTSDEYVKAKNKGELIESYLLRKKKLEKFLLEENLKDRVLIEPIDNIFVPKVWEELPIKAIIVSKNTLKGAEKINLKRYEQEKSSLRVEIAPLVKSESNEYISSSRIRNGEINREGKAYINPFWIHQSLLITKKLRRQFRKPFGTLFKSLEFGRFDVPYIITVGDVTTKLFNELSLNQDISVIDFKVARKKRFSDVKELGFSGREKTLRIVNPAGCLTSYLFKAVCEIFKFKKNRDCLILQIDGEEDLSVLPLTLAAPLGSVIFYGQPEEGVVRVEVSEDSKKRVYSLVSKFMVTPV